MTKKVLKVNNLCVSIKNNQLIDNISFEINKGEIFALVGQSGSGKSLTAYSILNLLPLLGNFKVSGEAIFHGRNNVNAPQKILQQIRGSKIGMIFQDPMTSLNPLHTIEKQLTEAIKLHDRKISKEKIEQKILDALDKVDLGILKERLSDFPHQLSGGQRQRVMIAMALVNNPELIIADEPTTALDVTVQREILSLLKKLQEKIGLSILLITHDLTIVKRVADRVGVMNKGKIVELEKTAKIFKNPQHAYTKKLLESEPTGKPVQLPKDTKKLLTADSLSIKYLIGKNFFGFDKKYFEVVKNVSLKLFEGETIGVVGESGSGKSTLAKALIKLIPSTGKIILLGEDVTELPEKDFKPYRSNIQIVYQDPYSSLNPRLTIKEIITEGLFIHKDVTKEQADKIVDDTLVSLHLPVDYKNRYPHELSGGEKQRIGLARSLILEPEVLILDEPTSALDLITQAEILRIIDEYQKSHKLGVLFISHDLRVIKSVAHYIFVMKNGEVISHGNAQEIFDNPQEEYTKNLIESAFLDVV